MGTTTTARVRTSLRTTGSTGKRFASYAASSSSALAWSGLAICLLLLAAAFWLPADRLLEAALVW